MTPGPLRGGVNRFTWKAKPAALPRLEPAARRLLLERARRWPRWTLAALYAACGPPPCRPLSDDWRLPWWPWWLHRDTARARLEDRNPRRRDAALERRSRRVWLHVARHMGIDERVEDEAVWRAEATQHGLTAGVEFGSSDNPALEDPTAEPAWAAPRYIPKPPLPELERRTEVYRAAELTSGQMMVFDLRVRGFHFGPLARALDRTPRALRYRSAGAMRTLSDRAWISQAPNLPSLSISRRCCYGGHVPFVLLDLKQWPPPTRFFCAHTQFWVGDLAATEQAALNGIHADHISEESQAS